MAISVNVKPPPLNRAAFELIQALDRVEDLDDYRFGLLLGARQLQLGLPDAPKLKQLVDVTVALEALADAVDARRKAATGG